MSWIPFYNIEASVSIDLEPALSIVFINDIFKINNENIENAFK